VIGKEVLRVKVKETTRALEESSELTISEVGKVDLDEEAELLLNHPQIIESFEKYPVGDEDDLIPWEEVKPRTIITDLMPI
jgi:hypothetical protein